MNPLRWYGVFLSVVLLARGLWQGQEFTSYNLVKLAKNLDSYYVGFQMRLGTLHRYRHTYLGQGEEKVYLSLSLFDLKILNRFISIPL